MDVMPLEVCILSFSTRGMAKPLCLHDLKLLLVHQSKLPRQPREGFQHHLGFGAARRREQTHPYLELPRRRQQRSQQIPRLRLQIMLALVPTLGRATQCLVVGLFASLHDLLQADVTTDFIAGLIRRSSVSRRAMRPLPPEKDGCTRSRARKRQPGAAVRCAPLATPG